MILTREDIKIASNIIFRMNFVTLEGFATLWEDTRRLKEAWNMMHLPLCGTYGMYRWCCCRHRSARASRVAAHATPDQHVRTCHPAPAQRVFDVILQCYSLPFILRLIFSRMLLMSFDTTSNIDKLFANDSQWGLCLNSCSDGVVNSNKKPEK